MIDVRSLSEFNDGVNWLLVAVDAFSKYAWVLKLKRKTAEMAKAALKHLIENEIGEPVESIFADHGTEWTNRIVRAYLLSQNIRLDLALSETKAAIAERFNRTLQDMMYKYMEDNKTNRYIDELHNILLTYRQRGHRTLRFMTPEDAIMPQNYNHVLQSHLIRYRKIKRKKPKLKVGQKVRVASLGKLQHAFHRGYHARFSYEQFEIVRISTVMPIPMYYLKSLDTEEVIEGGFYENMLSPIKGDIYKVNIIKERTRLGRKQYFVSYIGFGPQHNEWIDGERLSQLGNAGIRQQQQQQQEPETQQHLEEVGREADIQQQQLIERGQRKRQRHPRR